MKCLTTSPSWLDASLSKYRKFLQVFLRGSDYNEAYADEGSVQRFFKRIESVGEECSLKG
jgi:hypothetical protein